MTTQTISHSNNQDLEIARLTILSDINLINTVTSMVSHIANTVGISIDDSIKLQEVLKNILKTVIADSYEGDNTRNIDVIVSKRFNSLIVAVEDKGLPFQFETLEGGNDARFQTFMALGYADNV
ncbi:MAG: hypothetical protein ACRENO_03960, partial [Thermodesulfobacteriota bacterium]